MSTRILFLAAQLQPFLVSGIRTVTENNEVTVLVYAQSRPENELLQIKTGPQLRIFTYAHEPEPFFWQQIEAFKPEVVVCAGWMYFRYLDWCLHLKRKGAKTICAMDTQWKGSLKQHIWVRLAPLLLTRRFTLAWVPGRRQEAYARKLGFRPDAILHYLYAPDVQLFGQAFTSFCRNHAAFFPKTFVFAGRLEPHKMRNLLLAFRQLDDAAREGWTLTVIGNGSMKNDTLLQHAAIRQLPAMSQPALVAFASQGGVFCLCSTDEPWGTVVQEFAAAGFPLVVSRQCGSSEHFIEDNGFLCDGNDVDNIAAALLSVIALSDAELREMGSKSHVLGRQSDSATWASELMRVV